MMKTLLLPFAAEAVLDPGPSYSRRSSVDGAAARGGPRVSNLGIQNIEEQFFYNLNSSFFFAKKDATMY